MFVILDRLAEGHLPFFMFAKLIKRIASVLPSVTIDVDGKPYLTRYYVLLKDWKYFNIYIHHFHSSDQGLELHNHPWAWGLSYIVDGGYREEFRLPNSNVVQARVLVPGSINVIKHGIFHRVDLLEESKGSWTFFIAGKRTTKPPEWGFWNRDTHEFTYYKEVPGAIP